MGADEEYSDDDHRELVRLLAKFAERELDQFELMVVETEKWGPVWVTIANENVSGVSDAAFATVWPLPPYLNPAIGRDHPVEWVVLDSRHWPTRTEAARYNARSQAEEWIVEHEVERVGRYWIVAVPRVDR